MAPAPRCIGPGRRTRWRARTARLNAAKISPRRQRVPARAHGINGARPEDLPLAENIKQVRSGIKHTSREFGKLDRSRGARGKMAMNRPKLPLKAKNGPSKTKTLDTLRRALDFIPSLEQHGTGERDSASAFERWCRNTEVAIVQAFGDGHHYVNDFGIISYHSSESVFDLLEEFHRAEPDSPLSP
uniref:Uncharacterized protein n=1 Tax=Candidatus Kentrum sp. LFY TaxID=2126342 RepID=A0A450V030_9GAMM|nr:MAG: hypothetical protein BECKLFY1418A_GA0070994_10796 [Candidatus Kentron sp. LFY]